MKNSNDTIGNRTRNLPAFSAVPQPTAPPHTPSSKEYWEILAEICNTTLVTVTVLIAPVMVLDRRFLYHV